MDAMLGAIAFDTTTERTQRFTLDAIMNANNLAFFLEFFTGFYSQRPSVSNAKSPIALIAEPAKKGFARRAQTTQACAAAGG